MNSDTRCYSPQKEAIAGGQSSKQEVGVSAAFLVSAGLWGVSRDEFWTSHEDSSLQSNFVLISNHSSDGVIQPLHPQ